MANRLFLRVFASILLLGLIVVSAPAMTQDVHYTDGMDRPLLLAHYMPWYQTPEVSGFWGWHWTMDHFDPDQTDANGRPQIASYDMPLTGPYDSQDVALLEYQVLLMKLSGIDGVIVDWYGMTDFRDYAPINASTVKLFGTIQKAGLRFIICYEDQSIKRMVEEGFLSEDERHEEGQKVMAYLQNTWFNDPAYVRYQGCCSCSGRNISALPVIGTFCSPNLTRHRRWPHWINTWIGRRFQAFPGHR